MTDNELEQLPFVSFILNATLREGTKIQAAHLKKGGIVFIRMIDDETCQTEVASGNEMITSRMNCKALIPHLKQLNRIKL